MIICGVVVTMVGISVTMLVVLLIEVFTIWWVNALILMAILIFSVMCYIRYKTRQKLEVKLRLESEDYSNR